MNQIQLDVSHALSFFVEEEVASYQSRVRKIHHRLHQTSATDAPYLGWVEGLFSYDQKEWVRMVEGATRIRQHADVFIVIGVGGSYLGARAAIEMFKKPHSDGPTILFAGYHLSASHLVQLLDWLEGKEVVINVISKSGGTLEPAVTFRLLRQWLIDRYGSSEASKRIVITTDPVKGILKQMAVEQAYETFHIPPDVGGRYSVLTPVGLFPMCVAGIDIAEVVAGAQHEARLLETSPLERNDAYRYAVIRQLLYQKGKYIELLVHYEPALHYFSEWWKQLFGESEGKNEQGIFPSALQFTTDLHSLGQYIQQGKKILFETVLHVVQDSCHLSIPADRTDLDRLNYLSGRSLHELNEKAFLATMTAHSQGGVPCLSLDLPELTPYWFGGLVYFFQKACAMSSYLSGVNPFDQPGVQMYKNHLQELLER